MKLSLGDGLHLRVLVADDAALLADCRIRAHREGWRRHSGDFSSGTW
jgi:hypothetical protein